MESLPSPKEVKDLLPLSETGKSFIAEHRKQICRLINIEKQKMAIIMGPCSIHDIDSALEYGTRLRSLRDKVWGTCFLAMRVYLEKPRTSVGWKGLLYDPFLDGSNELVHGIFTCRKLLLSLVELNIPIATEFLDPLATPYFEDLISWGFVGARTSASQIHRQMASSLPMPMGFKNATDGNLDHAIQGVIASRHPHCFFSVSEEGALCKRQSSGNTATHVVLRGSNQGSNYDIRSIEYVMRQLQTNEIHPSILIDCSHGNSQKQPERQKDVFLSVVKQYKENSLPILGAMLESHLEAGSQSLSKDTSSVNPSLSITDPCIDWTTTEELVLSADVVLSSSKLSSSCSPSLLGASISSCL